MKLRKSLRFFEYLCLGINCIVGAGIYSNPSLVKDQIGPASILAFLICGAVCMMIGLCFCEMSGRYEETGGAYVYARHSFGPFVGFLVGWEIWLSSLVGWASVARVFCDHWKKFSPFQTRGEDAVVLIVLIGALSFLNFRGVRPGSLLSNFFAISKMVPLVIFLFAGFFFIKASSFTPFFKGGTAAWGPALIIALYSFSGFEDISLPAAEGEDARRDLPRAIASVLIGVTALYILIQVVIVGIATTESGSSAPLVDAAGKIAGSPGAFLMGIGALLSIGGINASIALTGPRALYALAEGGYLPSYLREIHQEFHTPFRAILINSALVFFLAATGTFELLLKLSVLASIWQYTPTCLAVLLKRKSLAGKSTFILPGGSIIPALALVICILLLFSVGIECILWNLLGLLIGVPFYLFSKRKEIKRGNENPYES